MTPQALTDLQLDTLREVGSIGAGHVDAALFFLPDPDSLVTILRRLGMA